MHSKEVTSKPDSKVQKELPPPPPLPNNATHPYIPTEKQPEPFQQDNDEKVPNDGEWTIVKRNKPRTTGRTTSEYVKQ